MALARALSLEPSVLLLDEPLSALDAQVRGQLRDEIRRLQIAEGISTLLVTHDQEEALVMADRVGVMNEGQIVQISSPEQLYQNPQSVFISQFVGVTNRIPGEISGSFIDILGHRLSIVNNHEFVGGENLGAALIRPEELQISRSIGSDLRVVSKQLRGTFTAVNVASTRLALPIRVDIANREAQEYSIGDSVDLSLGRSDIVVDKLKGDEIRDLRRLTVGGPGENSDNTRPAEAGRA